MTSKDWSGNINSVRLCGRNRGAVDIGGRHESHYLQGQRDNEFLGTNFGADEWVLIYTKLGNNINRPLTERFVASGYDLNVLREV